MKSLLDVVKVEDASGQRLYSTSKKLLQERNISLANIIGFASDKCTTISGFQVNLKKDVLSYSNARS